MFSFSVRKLIALLFAIVCTGLPALAYAVDDVQPAVLEVSLESRWISWDADSRMVLGHELEMGVGLAWYPSAFASLHGRIALGWNAVIDESFSYRYHNSRKEASNLANIEIAAFVDVHPAIQVLVLRAELSASSYFVKERAGIWLINAGIGIGAQPFSDLNASLRTAYFGVICRFPIYDEFEKVFSVKRKMPQIGLQVTWGF